MEGVDVFNWAMRNYQNQFTVCFRTVRPYYMTKGAACYPINKSIWQQIKERTTITRNNNMRKIVSWSCELSHTQYLWSCGSSLENFNFMAICKGPINENTCYFSQMIFERVMKKIVIIECNKTVRNVAKRINRG